MGTKMKENKIPTRLRPLFWSYDFDNISLKEHHRLIVKQILSYGNIEDWKWLVATYGDEFVKKTIKGLYVSEFRPATLRLVEIIFNTKPLHESRSIR
jgi:hypothetical protein